MGFWKAFKKRNFDLVKNDEVKIRVANPLDKEARGYMEKIFLESDILLRHKTLATRASEKSKKA